MEELIPNLCMLLKVYGVDLVKDSKWVKFGFRLLMLTSVSITIIWAIFRMKNNHRHISIDIILVLIGIISSIGIITVLKSRDRINSVFKRTKCILSSSEIQQIRKFDARMVWSLIIAQISCCLFFTMWCTLVDYQESLSMFLGFETPGKDSSISRSDHLFNLLMATVYPILVYYKFFCFCTCTSYYISVQRIWVAYSKNCFVFLRKMSKLTRKNGTDHSNPRYPCIDDIFKELLDRFKMYNELTNEINQVIGLIPLLFCAFLFGCAMGVMCYLMIYGFHFSIPFIIVETVVPQLVVLSIAVLANKLPCDTHDTMKRFKSETANFVTSLGIDPYSNPGSARLGHYLAQVPLEPPMVHSMFQMSRALPLLFCEAIIPFAIMLVNSLLPYKE